MVCQFLFGLQCEKLKEDKLELVPTFIVQRFTIQVMVTT